MHLETMRYGKEPDTFEKLKDDQCGCQVERRRAVRADVRKQAEGRPGRMSGLADTVNHF